MRENYIFKYRNKISASDYLLVLIFGINLMPEIKDAVGNAVLLGLMMLWSLFNLKVIVDRSGQNRVWMLILIIWLVTGAGITIGTNNFNYLKNYIFELLNLVFPYLAFVAQNEEKRKQTSKLYFTAIACLMIASNLYNLIEIKVLMGSSFRRTENSYRVIYTTVLFALIYLDIVIKAKPSNKRWVELLAFLLFGYCIICSGYTIACITFFVGVALLLINSFMTNSLKKMAVIILVILAAGYLFININSVFKALIANMDNKIYIQRFQSIADYLSGSRSASTLTARLDTYTVSLDAFLNYPISGKVWFVDDNSYIFTAIGYHSTILDNLGLFGLIFGIQPVLLMLLPLIDKLRHNPSCKALMISLIFSFVVILTFNNQIAGIGVVCYYFLPLYLFKKKKIGTERVHSKVIGMERGEKVCEIKKE